jgi:amino acid adenylation domain-containing protein
MKNRDFQDKLRIASRQNQKEREYWMEKLSGEMVTSSFINGIGTGNRRRDSEMTNFETLPVQISDSLSIKLLKLSNESDHNLHMILTAGIIALLYKYTGFKDLIIGTTIFKQHQEIDFINTVLPLRNHITQGIAFKELLIQVRKTLLEAVENQNYPFEVLTEDLNLGKISGTSPLFDVLVLMENIHDRKFIANISPNVVFLFHRKGTRLEGEMKYNPRRIDEGKMRGVLRHYSHLLEVVLANPNIAVSKIELITEEEKRKIIKDFNNTSLNFSEDETIDQLFEIQAFRYPKKVAVVHQESQLTYLELNRRSNQLSKELRTKQGFKHPVGIVTEASLGMVIGILGILKSGGAYLPISPTYPAKRVEYILKDSGAETVLVSKENQMELKSNLLKIDLDNNKIWQGDGENDDSLNSSENAAYLIYTSGTTGKPKAILVEHRNVLAYLKAFFQKFDISSKDIMLQNASYTFDLFVEEFFSALLRGGKLAIPGKTEKADPDLLIQFINRVGVTIVDLTPSLINEINQRNGLPGVRHYISGGDVLKERYITNLIKTGKVTNTYGPTETTVCAAYYSCTGQEKNGIPIGKPIGNYRIYILDKDAGLAPIGVPGELCIAGAGVTRGYLNNPTLTDEKFIQNPNVPNETIYRTGDLTVWEEDGNIGFLGRIDRQVNIRGFRIELKEIENRILDFPEIKETIVVERDEDENKFLCVYFTAGSKLAKENLKDWLSRDLPDYMIPNIFLQIEKFPLTPGGKIDIKDLQQRSILEERMYEAPAIETERILARIWSGVLEIEESLISTSSNFFEIGGHSLRAIKVISLINKELNVLVSLVDFLKLQTIKELSHLIDESGEIEKSPLDEQLVLMKRGKEHSINVFFIHAATGEVGGYLDLCGNLRGDLNYWGIRAERSNRNAPGNITVEEIAANYIIKIKKVQSEGPYFIAGWCIAGTIAFEIVRQMEQSGEEIGSLILINSFPPQNINQENSFDFTIETETELTSRYLPDAGVQEQLKSVSDIEEIWDIVLSHLEKSGFSSRSFGKLALGELIRTIPEYEQLSIRELGSLFNVIRTFNRARNSYVPQSKINAFTYFFKATQTEGIDIETWQLYNSQTLKLIEIDGDHFSIFDMPYVVEFSEKFKNQVDFNRCGNPVLDKG